MTIVLLFLVRLAARLVSMCKLLSSGNPKRASSEGALRCLDRFLQLRSIRLA